MPAPTIPTGHAPAASEAMPAVPMLTRQELSARLNALGYPVSVAKLAKCACERSDDEGPPVTYFGRGKRPKPYYELNSGIAWARALRSPTRARAERVAS